MCHMPDAIPPPEHLLSVCNHYALGVSEAGPRAARIWSPRGPERPLIPQRVSSYLGDIEILTMSSYLLCLAISSLLHLT